MGDSATFTMDVGELRVSAAVFGPRLNRAISGFMLAQAPKVQSYARANASWTDRTGNARQGLFANYAAPGDGRHAINLYHTMPYGIWLEVRFAGRNAIIRPTIQSQAPLVMKAIEGMLSKIGAVA